MFLHNQVAAKKRKLLADLRFDPTYLQVAHDFRFVKIFLMAQMFSEGTGG